EKAREVLEKVASKIAIKDTDTLKKVAMTAMSSKSASGHKELLADIAVKAVTTVAEQRADGAYFVDDDNIQIVKKQGGSIADTTLVDGIIVDKERVHPEMPSEVKRAKATGGKVVTKLDELSKDDLGFAKLVYEKKIGDDEMTFVTGCKNPKAVSILLRGGTEHVVDELERSLEDATSVVAVAIEDSKVITGGGSSAMEIALALRDFASTIGGREQIAIESFADAVEIIPRTLSENAGLDPIDILIELRKEHKKGNKAAGINVF